MTKKMAIWYAMVSRLGKGTVVVRPKYWHMGWNSQI
jgi:hypothetical protein